MASGHDAYRMRSYPACRSILSPVGSAGPPTQKRRLRTRDSRLPLRSPPSRSRPSSTHERHATYIRSDCIRAISIPIQRRPYLLTVLWKLHQLSPVPRPSGVLRGYKAGEEPSCAWRQGPRVMDSPRYARTSSSFTGFILYATPQTKSSSRGSGFY